MIKIKKIITLLLRGGIDFVNHHPKLRLCAIAIVNKLGLRTLMRSACKRFTNIFLRETTNSVGQLTPRAHQIYVDLKNAIKEHERENC